MRPSPRAVLTAALATLAVALGSSPAPAAAGQPPEPVALHATRGSDPGIFDSRGREVLLRGVNVNALGDYYRANPDYPTVAPLHRADFTRIRKLGFNTVRLLMSWSKLQPERGAFNRHYVGKLRRAVGWARKEGLYVVLDMHQDAWGKRIATRPGESCPPGTNRSVGWDGAPGWATLTDGLSTCNFGLREISPAVSRAWRSFYDDRDGIQTELVETWGRLAREFAGDPTVAGYDLLNEPGLSGSPDDVARLGEFYGRTIEAIRVGEAAERGGFDHIVFFEPQVVWSATATYPTPSPDFTRDRNIVFAPHLYAESISPVSIEQGFELAAERAAEYETTVWSGEWGYFAQDPAEDADKVRRYGEAEDAAAWGGAWWDYMQACGDPHMISTPGGEPAPLSVSLVRFDCTTGPGIGRPLGIPEPYRTVLSRPAPRAVPGEIVSLRSSGKQGTLALEGRAPEPACGLVVYAPGETGKPRVGGAGLSRVRVERSAGDWIVRACAAGRYSLSLK